MKVVVKDENGVMSEVTPKNIIVDGKPMSAHIKEIGQLRNEIKVLLRTQKEDVEELLALWETVKKRR